MADSAENGGRRRRAGRFASGDALDLGLVSELQASINTLAGYYRYLISQRSESDARFRKQLSSWFVDQGWTFTAQDQDYDRAARQTAYLLVNKLL
ncbi:MAG TPA: hypothetical protein VM487_02450, partial [Phycisphaerae bacterium]|nr:hypothetical protein [Phycisphaerae bacterium]